MGVAHKENIKLSVAFLLMLAGHILLAYFIKRQATCQLFATFAGLFLLYYLVCKQKVAEKQLYVLVAGAIFLRIAWLFAFPNLSDDYARFVWDGRLSIAGYDPFKYLPVDIMRHGLPGFHADAILYNALNSQAYYTCYPPLLQWVFAIAAGIFPHSIYGNIIILRLFNLVADTGSIFILISLCKRWKINAGAVLLYALNPIVIAEITGNLHFEGVMIFFLLATVYCWMKNKYWLSMLLFTAAVITKLIPLMFLPLIFFYLNGKRGLIFCFSVLLLTIVSWLPFVDASVMQKFWSSIDSYFQESEYNASIYYFVRDVVYHYTHENRIEIIGPVLTVISGLLIGMYAIWKRSKITFPQLLKYFTWTILIYYAFTTTVFPWYIIPAIVLSVFTGYKFPLIWSAVIVLSYYADRSATFQESDLLIWIEYITVAFAIAWDLYSERKRNKLVFTY